MTESMQRRSDFDPSPEPIRRPDFRPVMIAIYGDGKRLTDDTRYDAIDFRRGGISTVYLPSLVEDLTYRIDVHMTGSAIQGWHSFRVSLMVDDENGFRYVAPALPGMLYEGPYYIPSVTMLAAYPDIGRKWFALLMWYDTYAGRLVND